MALASLLYLSLIVPTIGRYGVSWDEQTDMKITLNYLQDSWGWLIDANIDPTQTRLPMFIVACVFRLLGMSQLILARYVSCVLGLGILWVGFFYCRRFFSIKVGVLSAFLLAVNPYFLEFSRTALTETDIYITFFSVVALFFLQRSFKEKTVGTAALGGISLGLVISSKAFGVALLPAAVLALIFHSNGKMFSGQRKRWRLKNAVIFFLLSLSSPSVIIIGWLMAVFSEKVSYFHGFSLFICLQYLIALILLMGLLIYIFYQRKELLEPILLACMCICLSGTVFLMFPPYHSTNPNIVFSLIKEISNQRQTENISTGYRSLYMHTLGIVFKSGLMMGSLLWLAFLSKIRELKSREEIRLPFLFGCFYILCLLCISKVQHFFMMPVFPVFCIFLADEFFLWFRRFRTVTATVAVGVILTLGLDLFHCYPDFNLNGFQWLGYRYVGGLSSVGCTSIVNIPFDGVQQSIDWANHNIEEGKTVLNIGAPLHIMEALENGKYKVINKVDNNITVVDTDEVNRLLLTVDYVITSLNFDINRKISIEEDPIKEILFYRYNRKLLESNYEKVFSLKRKFDIEAACVWKRK